MKPLFKNLVGSFAITALVFAGSPLPVLAQKTEKEKQALLLQDIKILEDSIVSMREVMTGILNDPYYIRWERQLNSNKNVLEHTLPDLRRNFPKVYDEPRFRNDSIASLLTIREAESELAGYRDALEYFRVSIQSLEGEIVRYREILSEKFPSPEEKRKKNMNQKYARKLYKSQKRHVGKIE